MTDEQHDTTLYVLVPPSPLFAAHWSLFLPESKGYDAVSKRHEESTVGRRIHVSGDRLNGFRLEIVREYDLSKHRSVGSRKFAIGAVPARHVQGAANTDQDNQQYESKDEEEGGGFVDNTPRDYVERVCVKVEAPGPSLNRVSGAANGAPGKKMKAEVRDCQWWVRQVINELTSAGMLASPQQVDENRSKSPNELVAELPVH